MGETATGDFCEGDWWDEARREGSRDFLEGEAMGERDDGDCCWGEGSGEKLREMEGGRSHRPEAPGVDIGVCRGDTSALFTLIWQTFRPWRALR